MRKILRKKIAVNKSSSDINVNNSNVKYINGNIAKLLGNVKININGKAFCFAKITIKEQGEFYGKNITISVFVDDINVIVNEGDNVKIKLTKEEDGNIRAVGYIDTDSIVINELEDLF